MIDFSITGKGTHRHLRLSWVVAVAWWQSSLFGLRPLWWLLRMRLCRLVVGEGFTLINKSNGILANKRTRLILRMLSSILLDLLEIRAIRCVPEQSGSVTSLFSFSFTTLQVLSSVSQFSQKPIATLFRHSRNIDKQ